MLCQCCDAYLWRLEFDDVIIYNFFCDSQAQKDEWRCLSQYQLDQLDWELDANTDTCKTLHSMRPLQFNRSEHMALNDELKHL